VKRIVACLLILLTAFASSGGAAASTATDCQDVTRYFERVDGAIVDGMTEIIAQPGFREHFPAADRKTDSDGPGFFALSTAEGEALIAYLSMPGAALRAMDEDEIPETIRELHDSAERSWTLLADMMAAVSEDGPSAAVPYFDRLDAASSDNLAAQQALNEACPDEVNAYAETSRSLHASSDLFGNDLLAVWEDPNPEELRGVGYNFLFRATDPDATTATPEPSAVRAIRVTA
jgi:hypothetical protein